MRDFAVFVGAVLCLSLTNCGLTAENVVGESSSDSSINFKIVDKCVGNCVRFCCEDFSECESQEFFDLSSLPQAENLRKPYNVMLNLSCETFFEMDGKWSFLPVSR